MWAYEDSRAALDDVLRLSRAMTFKAAVADLALGGGKGVIMVDPQIQLSAARRKAALLDFADTVQALGGHYLTAEDVGTSSRDMNIIAQRTRFVLGRARSQGSSGDPSPMTALGVEHAVRACCEQIFGTPSLSGRSVGVIGLGHVGSRVARRCARAGATLVVSDVDDSKRRLAGRLGASWTTPERALERKVDVLVPCALGGVFDELTVPALRCRIIAGAANNQLAGDGIADMLAARGILWAPDFVVNAGGLINLAVELTGYDPAVAQRRVREIADTLREIFERAQDAGITPLAAAMDRARQQLSAT
jgi:leucine dehydrogenase